MTDIIDYVVQEVKDYIYHIEEMGSWRGLSFEERSFARWAAAEIIERLKKRTDIPPLSVIESFKEEMYMYSCSNERTSFIFSIAVDVAGDIDDILINS